MIKFAVGLFLIVISFSPSIAFVFGNIQSTLPFEVLVGTFKIQLILGVVGMSFIAFGIDQMDNRYRKLRSLITSKHDPRILVEFDKENK